MYFTALIWWTNCTFFMPICISQCSVFTFEYVVCVKALQLICAVGVENVTHGVLSICAPHTFKGTSRVSPVWAELQQGSLVSVGYMLLNPAVNTTGSANLHLSLLVFLWGWQQGNVHLCLLTFPTVLIHQTYISVDLYCACVTSWHPIENISNVSLEKN